jgi:hypothetical protein
MRKRDAYQSPLVENLGFYMAHVRLSAVALFLHDTTTALNELETATLIRSDDPVLLTFRGSILGESVDWSRRSASCERPFTPTRITRCRTRRWRTSWSSGTTPFRLSGFMGNISRARAGALPSARALRLIWRG